MSEKAWSHVGRNHWNRKLILVLYPAQSNLPEIASNHLERSPVKILFVELVLDWRTSQKVKQISFVPNIRDSASMSNEGPGVTILWASIRLFLPSNSESFPSNPESSVIFGAILEMEDFSGDGKRSVWNGWDLKFYVNSSVKVSSTHVRRVTCGIFPVNRI